MGLIMNVVSFPTVRRIQAASISRAEFERLADLALDVVDQIVAILEAPNGDTDLEPRADAEPSLGSTEGYENQVVWLRGGDRDF